MRRRGRRVRRRACVGARRLGRVLRGREVASRLDRSPNVMSAWLGIRVRTPVGRGFPPFVQLSSPAAVTSSSRASAALSRMRTPSVFPEDGGATSRSQQASPSVLRVAAAARAAMTCTGSGRCCHPRRSVTRAASATFASRGWLSLFGVDPFVDAVPLGGGIARGFTFPF
jgi:hypothetical protein